MTLSEEERRRLARIDERGSDWRERRRARTVLLLAQGLSIDAVVAQQRIHRETVACHRDAWLARSFQGLRDLPRSGAPCKLSETHKQVLGAWAKKEASNSRHNNSIWIVPIFYAIRMYDFRFRSRNPSAIFHGKKLHY